MATNYTTKTASLRSTRIDTRQVAVNKKIEIGKVEKGADGMPTTGSAVDENYVSTETLFVKDTREGSETQGKRTDVMDILSTMKNGIDIGTDTSEAVEEVPGYAGEPAAPAYSGVSKLNFRGEYVTVVEDPDTHEITLWLNKSTAYPEFKSCKRANDSGYTADANASLSNVKTYTHDSDTFAITPGGTKNSAKVIVDGGSFGKCRYVLCSAASSSAANSALNSTNGQTFRVSSTQALFVRSVCEGVGEWIKIPMNVIAGKTYTIGTSYASATSNPFASGTAATKSNANGDLTVYYSTYPLTSAHAPNGRVPGTTEAQAYIQIDWDVLLTKDGGTASLEFAFDDAKLSAPTSSKITKIVDNRFFSEYTKPSIDSVTASYTSRVTNVTKVSGLEYNGTGSKVTAVVSGIKNTQVKCSNTTDARLKISAGGGTTQTFTISQLTCKEGTSTTHSNAEYSLGSVTLTTADEGTSNRGKCIVTATPVSVSDGTPKTFTLTGYWNNIPTSSATAENFGHETSAKSGYRMQNVTDSAGSYPNTTAVGSVKTVVAGTEYISAVCQYGSLVHPSKAAADGSGATPYAQLTGDAVFMRSFDAGKVGTVFTIKNVSGSSLTGAGVKVYWYDVKNSKWNLLSNGGTPGSDACSVTAGSITRNINTGGGEENATKVIIAIVMTKDAGSISPITFVR